MTQDQAAKRIGKLITEALKLAPQAGLFIAIKVTPAKDEKK